jgi:hypothetical protein
VDAFFLCHGLDYGEEFGLELVLKFGVLLRLLFSGVADIFFCSASFIFRLGQSVFEVFTEVNCGQKLGLRFRTFLLSVEFFSRLKEILF